MRIDGDATSFDGVSIRRDGDNGMTVAVRIDDGDESKVVQFHYRRVD